MRFAWLAVALGAATLASGQDEDALARRVFATFQESCFVCHGEEELGGLDLRTEESLRHGGDNGRVVVPHDPESSPLYRYVSHAARPFMPFGGDKLPETQVALIRQWIETGGSLAGVPEAVSPSTDARSRLEERPITEDERAYWAFVKPGRPPRPPVDEPRWATNPIDAFLYAAWNEARLTPVPRADPLTLVRRIYLDVLGLPPSPSEVERFLTDDAPDAWERLVDELLASPHYGERWARHWMDLVRYADSGGFEFDVDRPQMFRYRDYLVEAFNQDKPYDRFVQEQIAGDEIAPGSDEARIATGYLRLGPEGAVDRLESLDDLVTTTSLAFMGVTVGCARCHDHKFDPIPQKDYYRIQAVFFPTDKLQHPLAPDDVVALHDAETERLDAQIEALEDWKTELAAPYHQQIVDREIAKLPEYLQIAWRTPEEERTEGQRLNVTQIEDTLSVSSLRKLVTEDDITALMPPSVKTRFDQLNDRIEVLEERKPEPLPSARAIQEKGREPEPSYFLHRGSANAKGSVMAPGVLSVATDGGEWDFPEPPSDAASSWRRRGFAEWLTNENNPLTARVIVNRLWQHHFGEGIVRTPSNFGKMGVPPTHPELLDWLAVDLMDGGWRLKRMHRLMLTSEAYRLAAAHDADNAAIDPENRLMWRMPRVRLEAEIIRDAILSVSGSLDRTLGGPAILPYIDPDLFEKSSKRDWKGLPDSDRSTWRRSLYVFSKRSIRYPMFETFDQPNLIDSVGRRNRTTIAPQALILMNNPMIVFQAGKFAERIRREAGDDIGRQVEHAFRLTLGREPEPSERVAAKELVTARADGLNELCRLMFNLNEFLYRP